jgi:hypothetical protein
MYIPVGQRGLGGLAPVQARHHSRKCKFANSAAPRLGPGGFAANAQYISSTALSEPVDHLASRVGAPIHSICIVRCDMSALISLALDTVRGYAGSTAWAPLVRISRAAVMSLFRRIDLGCLLITDENGAQTRCGRDAGLGSHVCATPPRTELKVKREAFWVRLALFADMVCQMGSTDRRMYG